MGCTGWSGADAGASAERRAIPPLEGSGPVKRAVLVESPSHGFWEPAELPPSGVLAQQRRHGVVAARLREPQHPWLAEVAGRAWADPATASTLVAVAPAACETIGEAVLAARPSAPTERTTDGVAVWEALAGCPAPLREGWAAHPQGLELRPVPGPPDPLLDDLPSLMRFGPPPTEWAERYPLHLEALARAAARCVEHDDDVLVAERCLTGLATLDRPAGAALAEGLIARADAIEVPIARELVRWPTAAARDAELATLGLGPVVDTPSPHGEVLVDRLAAHGRAWRLHPSMYQEVHLQHLLESLSIEGVVVDSLHPTDASPRSWTALYVHHGGDRWRALLDGWTIDAEQLVGIANAVADRTDAAERLLLVEHVDGPRVLMGTEAALDTLVEAQLVYTPAPRERWSKQVEPSQDTGLSGTLMELLEAE